MNYSTENIRKRKKAHNAKGKKVKNKVGVIIIRVLVAAILISLFAFGGVLAGTYMGIIEKSPKLAIFDDIDLALDSTVLDKNGNQIDRLDAGENREYASFDQIPQFMKDAFVAIEDERFYSHNGIDMRGIGRAVYQTLSNSDMQGGSTITQQLIKNKLKIKRNSFETKLQEQYLAINYEKDLETALGSKKAAKDYILGQYMNIIALGNGQNGVQAAAGYYFNKDVSQLTLAECCVISAITQNPWGYNPVRFPESNKKRQMVALDNMLEFGMITEEQYTAAVNEDVYSKIRQVDEEINQQVSFHSYFVDSVISQVAKDLEEKYDYTPAEASSKVYSGGLTIETTMDPDIQKILDDSYMDESLFPQEEYEIAVTYKITTKNTVTGKESNHEKKGAVKSMDEIDAFLEKCKDEILSMDDEIVSDNYSYAVQPQSSMVVIDYHNGHVAGLAGGRGEKLANRTFNRATQAVRQPGSVFKVLASFAPALDMGLITAATVYDDVPTSFGNYSPKNWYSNPSYRGLNTVRTAIKNSMNIITVKNMQATGIENCFNYLRRFGFSTLVDADKTLSTALGGLTHGVTNVEVTSAYGSIANGGILNKPILYTRVLDHNGTPILENTPEPEQVLKKTTAFLLTDMMEDVITGGTGGKAAFKDVKMPIAGKTGTTSDNKDLNFVGFTPYYVASVWLGYDQPKPMGRSITSDGTHIKIWRSVMEKIHANLSYKDFDRPEGIVTGRICTVSGKLAVDGLCDRDPRGSTIRSEYFVAGTVPTEACNVHMAYRIDTVSGKIPGEFCPPETIEERVGVVRPEPYDETAAIGDAPYDVPRAVLNGEVCDVHNIHNGYSSPLNSFLPTDPGQNPFDEPIIPVPPETAVPPQNTGDGDGATTALDLLYTNPTPSPTPAPTPVPTPEPSPIVVPEATSPPSNEPVGSEERYTRPLIVDSP